jgi:hypothetical protein
MWLRPRRNGQPHERNTQAPNTNLRSNGQEVQGAMSNYAPMYDDPILEFVRLRILEVYKSELTDVDPLFIIHHTREAIAMQIKMECDLHATTKETWDAFQRSAKIAQVGIAK